MTAEREYVSGLLKNEGMRELSVEINQNPPEMLFAMAQSLVEKSWNGANTGWTTGKSRITIDCILISNSR